MRVLVCVWLVACTYTPPIAPAADDAAVDTRGDAMRSDDSPIGSCISGARSCVDATHSGHCENGEVVIDRDCPPGSGCVAGSCAPPTGATPCSADADCVGTVCDVYVVGNGFQGFCTQPLGAQANSCATPGNDPTCDSGICATGAGQSVCLSPCHAQNECNDGNRKCVGVSAPTTIEGLPTGTLKHCVPNNQ